MEYSIVVEGFLHSFSLKYYWNFISLQQNIVNNGYKKKKET